MAYSIMEALFDGRIIPWERRNAHTPERMGLEKRIEEEKQYFMKKLSADDGRRLQDLEDLWTKAAFDEEVEIYSHGFTLGALLITEIMAKKETMVNGQAAYE